MTGQTIGRYEIFEELGRGGMATVFRGHDPRFKRDVAIKVLPREFVHDPNFSARFEREAHTIAALEHSAIVPVYDYGEDGGQPYLVMRFMGGGSLSDRIREGPMRLGDAVTILERLSSALDYAHSQGVIHRDLKPANILFDTFGDAYLSDFGIARIAEASSVLTSTGTVIGTPAYMSPEQVHGDKKLDGRSDIYSLGIIFFEMITGEQPYQGDTPAKLMMKHVLEPVPRVLEVKPDLPAQTDNILSKVLAKERDERFPTAGEFVEGTQNLLKAPDAVQVVEPAEVQPVKTLTETMIEAEEEIDTVLVDEMPELDKVPPAEPSHEPRKMPNWIWGLGAGLVFIVLGVIFIPRILEAVGDDEPVVPVGLTPLASATQVAEVSITDTQVSDETATLPPDPAGTQTALAQTQIADSPRGKIVFTCQLFRDERYNQICLMDADGSNQRRLSTTNEVDYNYPSIAPDGESVLYTSNESGAYEIYEMDLRGNAWKLTNLGDAYAPTVSPDGTQIVFTQNNGERQAVWIMNRDGSNPRALTNQSTEDAWDPVWSPDGESILFASNRVGGIQLFIMQSDGTNVRQVGHLDGMRGRNDWSSDGFTLSTYVGPSWEREIVLLDVDGLNLRQITDGGNNLAPSFSPDGEWIAFTSYRDMYKDPHGCEIYIMRTDGSQVTRLTQNEYCDWQPRWGP